MIECSDGYKSAIVGDTRRMYIKAVLELIDPDIVYSTSSGSGVAPFGKPEQLYDKEMVGGMRYATLEPGRWVLDGSASLIPDNPADVVGEVGYVGNTMSDDSGYFDGEVYAEIKFENVSILQACSVYFSEDAVDGVPEDFRVAVLSGDAEIYSKEYTGNSDTRVSLDGFTVYDPTAIRIYVTKWSIGRRRVRIMEILPGVYEEWTQDTLASLDIQMRGNFACLALPYGVCTLRMDNLDRRFEPRNKTGVFKSIEERQGIPVALGVKLDNGVVEYKQVGIFYQANGGWKTGDNAMTMQWELVDIIGLIADREFIASSTLPTTLSGWVAAIVAQLGTNFENKYHVDPNYASLAATVQSADDVNGKRCGDILRWVCMATGTWPRADAETGYLTAEPLWSQGNKMDLDNMSVYPVMKANDDLAALIFKLYDGKDTTLVVSGNATSSSNTLTISNPFIHTEAQALTASKQILSQYGGIKLETIGRGDPTSEIGDVDTVWLDESGATTGRRMEQSFVFSNGVLRDCKSVLLQADGSFLFENKQVFTRDGVFRTGANTTQLRLVIVQGGQGSTAGADGDIANVGSLWGPGKASDGNTGLGGMVWSGVINVNPNTDYVVTVGKGTNAGKAGETVPEGGHSTFGVYSSASGKRFEFGFSDIASGDSYGRTGVQKPVDGTGDGAVAGVGGFDGSKEFSHWEPIYNAEGEEVGKRAVYTTLSLPTKGTEGADGADGCVVVYWDKEAGV